MTGTVIMEFHKLLNLMVSNRPSVTLTKVTARSTWAGMPYILSVI